MIAMPQATAALYIKKLPKYLVNLRYLLIFSKNTQNSIFGQLVKYSSNSNLVNLFKILGHSEVLVEFFSQRKVLQFAKFPTYYQISK